MAAAYTFLQRNPKHELTAKYLSYYRGMLDIGDESLTDLEAQPYEVWGESGRDVLPWCAFLPLHPTHTHLMSLQGSLDTPFPPPPLPSHAPLQAVFLRAVKLYNSGDFRSSTEDMERALAEYMTVFARCLAGCEGAHEQVDFKDFYPAIAGIYHSDRVGVPHPQCSGFPDLLRSFNTWLCLATAFSRSSKVLGSYTRVRPFCLQSDERNAGIHNKFWDSYKEK